MASSGAARRRDAVSWLIVGPFLIPMRVAEIVTDLVGEIEAGEAFQVVPSQRFEMDTDADPATWGIAEDAPVAVVWLNSPGNPDGHVLSVEQMARIVAWAGVSLTSSLVLVHPPWKVW